MTDEEVNARFSDKFNEWCDNFLKNNSSKEAFGVIYEI